MRPTWLFVKVFCFIGGNLLVLIKKRVYACACVRMRACVCVGGGGGGGACACVCVGGGISLNLKLFAGEPEIVSIFSSTTVLRRRNPLHIYWGHFALFSPRSQRYPP